MRMTPQRAVAILRGVADALDYAHAKGVMHRDVKPANILLDEAGRVYLADFGIARLVEGATALTAAGLISGTPVYMAPEQATGLTLDHRVDIYALGVVAYEVLAGRVPFAADNPIDVLMKHVQSPVPVVPDLPAPVMDALLKALAKKPQDRWQSAGALVAELEATIAQMPVVGASPTTPGMTAIPLAGDFWTARRHAAAGASDRSLGAAFSARRHVGAHAAIRPAPRLRRSAIPPSTSPRGRQPCAADGPERASRAGLIAVIVGGGGRPRPRRGRGPVPVPADAGAGAGRRHRAGRGETARAAAALPARLRRHRAPSRGRHRARDDGRAAGHGGAARRDGPAGGRARRSRPPQAPVALAAASPMPPPAATVPRARGTLRLDVNAVQPAFGAMSASMDIDVRVDGEPMRTVSIRFDGTTPFARSRRRQTFDVPGIRVGQRNVSVVVRADGVEARAGRDRARRLGGRA